MSLRIQLSGFGGQDNQQCVCGSQVSLAASTFVHRRARLQWPERARDIALRPVASSALSFPASTALGNRARHTSRTP
ncbi:hypothetical protein CA830_02025 [Burkholderia multivorans]|nr:hypothetical protein CA831_03320 [Burkholderia multivorans]OXH94375.1 hypothetical protein CA830_02025 [Burkholderia multivorans]